MKIDEYQESAEETAIFPDELPEEVDAGLVYCVMGLSGEAGECLEKVKKAIREDDEKYLEELEDELGDVLWYWSQAVNELGKNGNEIALDNLEKLLDRQVRGKLEGKGDNR
jgi:NTP pyrophosphatase (non-canonical NTP hydrolase)